MILRSDHYKRGGWAIIYALVVLAVLTAFMAIAAQNGASARRLLSNRADQLQAQWLARAGLELAAERWRADPNYTGEVVELIPDSRVEIKVDKVGTEKTVRITCDAQYTGMGGATSRSVPSKLVAK